MPYWRQRLRHWLLRQRGDHDDLATERDIYYAYRLLLNRRPDREGLAHWRRLVYQHGLTVQALVDGFVEGNPEFAAFRAARQQPQLVTLPDCQLFVRPGDAFVGAVIASEHQYEPHVTAVLRRLLPPGATFVDVGANIGYFTVLAATLVGPAVVAFEPNPDNCDLLRQSVAVNELTNVTLHQIAAGDRHTSLPLQVGGGNSNGMLVNAGGDDEPASGHFFRVDVAPLDDYLADLAHIDLIKIDIEGAEPLAWSGLQATVARHQPRLVLECAPDLIQRTSRVAPATFLAELAQGHDLSIIAEHGQPNSATVAAILAAATTSTHVDLLAEPRPTR